MFVSLKNPVSRIVKRSQSETNVNGIAKGLLFSAILSIINVFSYITLIISRYSSNIDLYSNLSYSEVWSKRLELLKNSNLLTTFFKGWIIFAIAILVGVVTLFVIGKLLKSEIKLSETASIVNNSIIPYMTISILAIILGYFYLPIKLFITFFAILFTAFTLLSSYRVCLKIKNTDSLVVIFSIVTTIVLIVVIITIVLFKDISLNYTTSLLEMLSLLNI